MPITAPELLWAVSTDWTEEQLDVVTGYLLYAGVDFEFDNQYRIPHELPTDVTKYRAVLIASEDIPRHHQSLAREFPGITKLGPHRLDAHHDAAQIRKPPPIFLEHRSAETVLMSRSRANLADPLYLQETFWWMEITVANPNLFARMQQFDDERLIADLVHTASRYRDFRWYDPQGGMMRALLDYHDINGGDQVLDYLEKFIAGLIEQARPPDWKTDLEHSNIDGVHILASLLRLHAKRPNPKWVEIVREGFEAILKRPRWQGCIVTIPGERWVRDGGLGVFVSALLRMASTLGRMDEVAALASHQILFSEECLRDRETGLWRFAGDGRRQTPTCFGHGTAWNVLGLAFCLEFFPRNHPRWNDLVAVFRRLADATLRYQAREGHWHQIVDQPITPRITHYTAQITQGLLCGHRIGLLDDRARQAGLRGWQSIKTCLWDGKYTGSGGGAPVFSWELPIWKQGVHTELSSKSMHVLGAGVEVLRTNLRR